MSGDVCWMDICRKQYPSDVNDEEWSLIALYLLLQRKDAGQREHDLHEVFNGPRYIVKMGRALMVDAP